MNGVVAHGRNAIEDLYKSLAAHSPASRGKFHMLLDNPKIVVHGDTATAGREHDELVKRSGRWYFKYRVITSDGGMPATFEQTYKDR